MSAAILALSGVCLTISSDRAAAQQKKPPTSGLLAPSPRNNAVADALSTLSGVIDTVDSVGNLVGRIRGLAERAQSDQAGRAPMTGQARSLAQQIDILTADQAATGVNLVGAGARDWVADLVGDSHRVRGVDLSAKGLGVNALDLTTDAGAAAAIAATAKATDTVSRTKQAYERDRKAIAGKRQAVPVAAKGTPPAGGGTAPTPQNWPGGTLGTMPASALPKEEGAEQPTTPALAPAAAPVEASDPGRGRIPSGANPPPATRELIDQILRKHEGKAN
ncbi:MAG: hypothetical protein JNK11_04340 [Alphaproteobacteria bacterium]|nr:hypothetical protein [Alphaproteobacteria bacterium]